MKDIEGLLGLGATGAGDTGLWSSVYAPELPESAPDPSGILTLRLLAPNILQKPGTRARYEHCSSGWGRTEECAKAMLGNVVQSKTRCKKKSRLIQVSRRCRSE